MTDARGAMDELLGAFALDAVDPDERELVERYLEHSPRARSEVADYREVAALLAQTGAPAPDGVWERIADSLGEAPPELRLTVAPREDLTPVRDELGAHRASRSRAVPMLLAVAAVFVLILGFVVVRQGQRINDVESDLDQALGQLEDVDLQTMAGLAMVSTENRRVELASADTELVVEAVVQPDGTGYLLAGELPELPDDRTYQLWGVADGGEAISLGVLGNAPDISTFLVGPGVGTLAITEEIAPGVVTSEQDPAVAGTFS